jgi:hypothetical protein
MDEMTAAIKEVFNISWDRVKDYGIEDTLEVMLRTIPDATYYHDFGYDKQNVNKGREYGLEMEKEGKTLYMITDNPDIVHFAAFDKKWLPVYNIIKKYLDPDYYLEDFSAADLVWEGE